MMKAQVVVLVVVAAVLGPQVALAKKKEGAHQEDFEFVEDGREHTGTTMTGERRLWLLDPDNALCGLLRCGRREVCLLQDRFTAVCVNKAEVTRNGDKIIPLKDAASGPDEDLPKSWDALDDYDDDDDDDEDYYDEEDEDDEYLLEGDEDDDGTDQMQFSSQPKQQQQQQQSQQKQQQPGQQQQSSNNNSEGPEQRLNRRPFAEKQCPSCPVVRPIFLCGSDNRTYSSLCRLHYHNCIHDAAVRIACKGFCPCRDPNSHLSKKERQRERLDAYITKLRATKDDTGGASSDSPSSGASDSPSSSSSSSSSSTSRPDDRDNTTRGRLREGSQKQQQQQGGGSGGRGGHGGNKRDKHGRGGGGGAGGDKYSNRVRSRFAKVKGGHKGGNGDKNGHKYGGGKYNKDSYRQLDKYNAQRRPWSRRNNNNDNEATYKSTNTVWGPNECTQEALEAMGNRMLDWFSVIMADARNQPATPSKAAPSWCKPEVSWMLAHLDGDKDGRLSVKELYQLEHDDHERCIKPFIDRCDLDRDIFLSAREWCKCFDKSERPCAALRKASKGLIGGYIPECDSEGYYQPTQCHTGAGVCWCVDRHGVELPSTRTRNTPNCDAIVNSEEVSNYVEGDDEDGDDDMDIVEGSADMPLDI